MAKPVTSNFKPQKVSDQHLKDLKDMFQAIESREALRQFWDDHSAQFDAELVVSMCVQAGIQGELGHERVQRLADSLVYFAENLGLEPACEALYGITKLGLKEHPVALLLHQKVMQNCYTLKPRHLALLGHSIGQKPLSRADITAFRWACNDARQYMETNPALYSQVNEEEFTCLDEIVWKNDAAYCSQHIVLLLFKATLEIVAVNGLKYGNQHPQLHVYLYENEFKPTLQTVSYFLTLLEVHRFEKNKKKNQPLVDFVVSALQYRL